MDDLERPFDDDQLSARAATGRTRLIVGACLALLAVGALGGVGKLSGTGWFGHRSWRFDGGELYALNMSAKPLLVSVDGRPPVEVLAENARLLDLVGGTSTVTVTDAAGAPVATHTVTIDGSHALLKLTDAGCLAAVELGPYYSGRQPDTMAFAKLLRADTRVWVPHSKNIVWPRKPFPRKLRSNLGPGLWVELVACELLDERELMSAYLEQRLVKGIKKALAPPTDPNPRP